MYSDEMIKKVAAIYLQDIFLYASFKSSETSNEGWRSCASCSEAVAPVVSQCPETDNVELQKKAIEALRWATGIDDDVVVSKLALSLPDWCLEEQIALYDIHVRYSCPLLDLGGLQSCDELVLGGIGFA